MNKLCTHCDRTLPKMELSKIIDSITNQAKLERDRGLTTLEQHLPLCSDEEFRSLVQQLIDILLKDSMWEAKQGSFLALSLLVVSDKRQLFTQETTTAVKQQAMVCLEHDEARVRLAAGELLGTLCGTIEPSECEEIKNHIVQLITTNLQRYTKDLDSTDPVTSDKLDYTTNPASIFHESAGWRFLETSMKALEHCIEGCGNGFQRFVTPELMDLLFETLNHTNRFVRETGYMVCGVLSATCPDQQDQFAEHFALGLADNWSQVRMAASVATRKLMMSLPEATRSRHFAVLLPRMCLNRYYVAEGVKLYSQESWRQVTGVDGKELVAEHIGRFVQFYVEQSEADNHAVREAACSCIAELASKIEKTAVGPHVQRLLDCLVVCFKDDSWPVRDAACLACGQFVSSFPDESRHCLDTALLDLFYVNLADNIPSVRQGAAASLAKVAAVYGKSCVDQLVVKIKSDLPRVEEQQDTIRFSNMEGGPGMYGVIKERRDNDDELHTNKTMYSCGSLAPKMRAGGCSDHHFRRDPEKWEAADGCVYLMAELAAVPVAATEVVSLLPMLSRAAAHHHYTQHVAFLETVCRQLPLIARRVNKRHFKQHLEPFLDVIFYSLSCRDNQLTSAAAHDCLQQLGNILGPGILRGRCELYNPHYLTLLDNILQPF